MGESESVVVPDFSQYQLIQHIQQRSSPRQRALLSVLAICQKHRLEPAKFVASLSGDMPRTPLESRRRTRKFLWSRVRDFSEDLGRGRTVAEGLELYPGLLPDTVELALRLESERGTLDDLNDAWLSRPIDYGYDASRNESFVATMVPLLFKTFIILWVIAFMMIFLVPQLYEMLDDFGLAVPPVFRLAVKITDVIFTYSFVPIGLFTIALPFLIPSLIKYFRRWNPFTWKQPVQPSAVSTRQALALVLGFGKPESEESLARFTRLKRALDRSGDRSEAHNGGPFDWGGLVSRGVISGKEARALATSDTGAVQGWVLQKLATTRSHRIEGRGAFVIRMMVVSVNVALGALVLLLVFSVFTTLINIMSHLR